MFIRVEDFFSLEGIFRLWPWRCWGKFGWLEKNDGEEGEKGECLVN
jgi:hypothetical protein